MIRELNEEAAFAVVSRPAVLYGAVNKYDLSTGETGELVPKNLGFGLNHGVERAPPRCHISKWRESCPGKNQRNVADTGEPGG
jgi:hypothetical protein